MNRYDSHHNDNTASPEERSPFLAHLLIHVAQADHEAISKRFAQHGPALLERLRKLYGHHDNFKTWTNRLCEAMGQLSAARPPDLHAQDRQRAADPQWFTSQHALAYCAYVDRFAGNLKSVAKRIPHLQELGVTYLHLLPFLSMRAGENDGGFAVTNFEEVEPRLGTMADLRNLTAALRAAGISLCSDFVLNHVADTHPWAIAAKNGDEQMRDFFHTYSSHKQASAFERTLGQVFPDAAPHNFSFNEPLQRWVWTTFYPYQWDLNYANPEVFLAMVDAMLHLANQGVEVFRLDSTGFLWKRLGTNCMNQPEVHWILQALRCIVDIVAPGVLLKAEAIVQTAELPAYLGDEEQHECHLAYHSTLMASAWAALAEQDAELLKKVMAGTPALPQQASWLTYVRCHDDIGWNVLLPEVGKQADAIQRIAAIAEFYQGDKGSYARGADFHKGSAAGLYGTNGMASALVGLTSAQTAQERDAAARRLMLLYGLAFSFGGMPLIYMGDELAQQSDDSYLSQAALAGDSRWMQRPLFDPEAYSCRHDAETINGRVFQGLRHLLQCRATLTAFAAREQGQLLPCELPGVVAYLRGTPGKQVLCLANFSSTAQELDLHLLCREAPQYLALAWRDVLSDAVYERKLMLDGLSQVWLQAA